MRVRCSQFSLALLLGFSPCIQAMEIPPYEVHGYIDLKSVAVDSPLKSFMNGGLGLLRYDEHHDGLRIDRLALDVRGPVTETVRAHVTAVAAPHDGGNAIDLTQAFLEWRPYPQSHWRWRTKLGAFYPPVSLENVGAGWQSIYSLSASAINTWIGEEVRSIGMEVTATSMGASLQRPFDVGLIAGVYGWNDPMGVLIFQRGWAIHDYETPVFGDLPRPLSDGEHDGPIEFSQEIDDRAGYYAGIETRWQRGHVLRVLHYDNRGDPGRENRKDYAWLSRFDAVGARLELPWNLTLIAQGMRGDTAVGHSDDGRGMLIADFWSWFGLASVAHDKHRVTLRYDRMYVESTRGAEFFESRQNAHAWTAAYLYVHDEHWLAAIEALRIDGMLGQREILGLPAAAIEQQIQVAVRYSF